MNQIIEFLQGSCMNSLDDAVQEFIGEKYDSTELTEEELAYLDDNIFECECCGWWCEISEMSEYDQRCESCFEDQGEL